MAIITIRYNNKKRKKLENKKSYDDNHGCEEALGPSLGARGCNENAPSMHQGCSKEALSTSTWPLGTSRRELEDITGVRVEI